MKRMGFVFLLLLIAGLAWGAYAWGRTVGGRSTGQTPETKTTNQEERAMEPATSTVSTNQRTAGRQRLEGVSRLQFTIVNGNAAVTEGKLPAGVVELSWEYTGRGVEPDPELEHLNQGLAGGALTLTDWRKPNLQQLKSRNVNLKLKLTHGPGITRLGADHANGDFSYTGNAACDIKLANGTLTLAGAPAGAVKGAVANGRIDADLLLTAGSSSLSVANGTVNLSLRDGSAVGVQAGTVTGEINGPAWLASKRRNFTGAEGQGVLGSGAGQLRIDVVNGAVKIK